MAVGPWVVYGNAKHQLLDGNLDFDTHAFSPDFPRALSAQLFRTLALASRFGSDRTFGQISTAISRRADLP